jgi:histidinol-phosphate/aromatic aminotransferase/cobyric acid decarboxylase-like protein
MVLRSMTKDFALAGLRLGYAVAAPALIEPMQQTQPPWNVNEFAQIAGQAAMGQLDWLAQSLATLQRNTASLHRALDEQGFAPLPTDTNYFLMPAHDATALRTALLTERMMVRDCTSFGLPQFIRIATQLPEQNDLLIQALVRQKALVLGVENSMLEHG